MDPISQQLMMGAAGSGGPKLYVEDVFSTWLYTGNGSTQTITNGIDLSGKGGMVWIKARNQDVNHTLVDTARGGTARLESNTIAASATASVITSFASTGFNLGSGFEATWNQNTPLTTYASWTFRKAAKFFDVVTYTGSLSNLVVNHNLGSTPGCIIIKQTNGSSNWLVYHRSTTDIYLNLTNAATGYINECYSVNSNSFTVAYGSANTNLNASATYVAYLFAHDAGGFGDSGNDSVVKCGGGTVSGLTTVDLGWEPQWILFKKSSGTGNWILVDNMRGFYPYGGANGEELQANTSAASSLLSNTSLNITSTGFTIDSSWFGSGSYIYIAIRRGPMKTPTDATKVFSANVSAASAGTKISAGFALDMNIAWERSIAVNAVYDRLRGVGTTSTEIYRSLRTSNTDAENTSTGFGSSGWDNTGFNMPSYAATLSHIFYSFRRAPGFMDVVAYTGTGANQQVTHNLGVVPEMMIIKNRSGSFGWAVYHSGMGADLIELQSNIYGSSANANWWDNGAPTASVIKTPSNSNAAANRSGDTFIAYLFASLTGISKVGSYTGTGTTLSVDCGFTSGARFVLIRRKDAGGDWYVWDTARGIVSGNDPYLLLNSTAAENTSTDYIDPLSSGFQISSTAPAAINANGGSFIFLAIA